MRHVCGMALVVASLALGGCVNSTFDSLSSLSTGCSTSTSSVACTSPTPVVTPPTPPPTSPSGTPIVNTGNNVTLTSGDTTIALESSVDTTPVGAPAISKLISSPLTIAATANQQIWFNTNTATNGLWPVSKTLTYNDFDTCVNNGGINPATAGVCAGGVGGTGLGGNYKAYRYYQPGTYDEELQIWSWNNSYATQYRDVTASGTDPQHQAWSFGGNYTPAAAIVPLSGIVGYAGQWTGTAKTTNFDPSKTSITVPLLNSLGAVVLVNGVPQTTSLSQTVTPSNNWRANGTSALTANFGTATLTGNLSSTNWQGLNNNNGLTNIDPVSAKSNNGACLAQTGACDTNTLAGQAAWQNWVNWNASFMNSKVVLNGNITTSLTNTSQPNQVTGTAVMDANDGWVTATGTNPMFAGFFGPVAGGKPQEVTGNFALKATLTSPNGGNAGINLDRRATIEMSGIFNGQ